MRLPIDVGCCWLFLFVVMSVPAATGNAQDATADARKQLTGTWEGYAVEDEGERPDRGPVAAPEGNQCGSEGYYIHHHNRACIDVW